MASWSPSAGIPTCCVAGLIESGGDPNGFNDEGTTTHLLAELRKGHIACVVALIRAGADVDQRAAVGFFQPPPIVIAASFEGTECVEALIAAGADVNQRSGSGDTAVHVAAKAGRAAHLSFLARAGAALDLSGSVGNTPLCLAARQGHVDCVKVLLEHGANMNGRRHWGITAAHDAASARQSACLRVLIDAGADLNLGDDESETPLFYAVASNDDAVVQTLLRADTLDARHVFVDGLTPVYLAARARAYGASQRTFRRMGVTDDAF